MAPALESLIDIQRIDQKIDTLEKQRATFSEKLNGLKKKLDETKLQLNTVDTQINDKEKERRTLDSNLQLDSAKLKKWETRLNEIRNQREFLALDREVSGQKKQNTESQEKVTLLANEIKELSAKREALRDDLAELEVDIDAEQTSVDAKLAEVNATLSGYQKERAEFATQVPANFMKRYDLVRTRRGNALAPVASGRCTACNMGLPPQLNNIVMRGETIETCPSCNRMLYHRELEKPAEAQTS